MLQPGDAMSYSNRGFAYESAGEFDKAVADFNQAIRLWPGFAEAYAGRGIAWVGRGEFDLAIADLDEAIRLETRLRGRLRLSRQGLCAKGRREAGSSGRGQSRLAARQVDHGW